MKTNVLSFLLILLCFTIQSQDLKPYIVGTTSEKSLDAITPEVRDALQYNGFEILGSYNPANDKTRVVLAITYPSLIESIKKTGGLTGFAAVLRVAITREASATHISYTNPYYLGHAYFRDAFNEVEDSYDVLNNDLVNAMKAVGPYAGDPFGSEDGISSEDLHDYHYMIGMPYFDDTNVVGEFGTYEQAVRTIDSNLTNGIPNVSLVYKVEIPGKDLALYGIGLSGENGESLFLPKIDISSPKHTAFLPYEILVMGSEVHMLHGKYRIALSFPDLTMMTFTKIMSTPGNIEDMMKTVTGQ